MDEGSIEKPVYVTTKYMAYACPVPKSFKDTKTHELIQILPGTRGELLTEYMTDVGVKIGVIMFHGDDTWSWLNVNRYEVET